MGALPRQMVDMPFSKGLNTKADPFQIPLGDLLILQNAVFTAPGKIQKRNGYAALVQSILGGGTIANPTALFARGNELCQIGGAAGQTLYSYDASNTAWATKGNMPSVGVSVSSAAQPQYSTYAIDMAVAANGLQCFVYELVDTNAPLAPKGIGYTIVDSTSGLVVVPPSFLDSNTTTGMPHVLVLGTNFVCYYVKGVAAASGDILCRTLSSASPTAGWSASTTLTSGVTTSAISLGVFNFDACADANGTHAYIAFQNRSASTSVFQTTSGSPLAVALSTTSAMAGNSMCVFMDLNGNIAVGVSDSPLKFTVLSTAFAVVKSVTAISGAATAGQAITGTSTAAGSLTFFFGETTSTNAQKIYSGTAGGVTYGTVVNAAVLVRSLAIGGKAFTLNSSAYLPAWYSPNTGAGGLTRFLSPQNGLYLIDSTGRVLSKALIGTTGAYDTISLFNFVSSPTYQPGSAIVSGNNVTVAASSTNILESVVASSRFGATPGTSPLLLNYQFGVSAVSFSFSDAVNGYQRQQIANAVHTNGGVLQMYDGQNVVEHGFLIYPAFISAALAAGGALAAGTYQAVAVYEWMDGQGQLHRSTPSTPVSFTATAAQKATYTVPTLRVSAKTGVMLQIYRTIANGTVFYQVTNFNGVGSLYNDPTTDSLAWQDTQSDTAILGNPQLYTTGGVLQNDPPPPAGAMCVHRNRLFVVDEFGVVWYSKEVVPPAPVEFSGFQKLNIDPKGGKTTALASLDDKLIAFKADRVFMVLGQGPDSTGNNNDFTDSILVSADTGCVIPKSAAVVPDGIMFQSPKGIYLLNRALRVGYIGAALEGIMPTGLTFESVSCVAVVSTVNQIRFGTPILSVTGSPLNVIYDYALGQWGTTWIGNVDVPGSDASTVDACVVNGQYYALTNDSNIGVFRESIGDFIDIYLGTSVNSQISLTTGWIKLAGLQGFQRAYKMLILGTGTGRLRVKVAYDHDTTIAQTTVVTTAPVGGSFQARVDFARQKCSAIRLSITDLDGNITSLSGISLDAGVKRGANRLPASKSFG